jgi:hypothetical protein
MSYFTNFKGALEEAEFCAKEEKLTYGIRVEGEQFEVYQVERRGAHNPLEISGRTTGK